LLTEGVTQPGNVTVTLPVTLRNATDIDIDIKNKNKNKENIDIEKKYILPEWINRNIFDAFVEMRKKIKKPLTDHAIKLAIVKLEKLRAGGENPNEILNEAILRTWTGLWSLKDKKSGGQNGRFSEHRSTAGQNSNRPQTQERTSDEYRRGLEGI
jgi:hypothetical protein